MLKFGCFLIIGILSSQSSFAFMRLEKYHDNQELIAILSSVNNRCGSITEMYTLSANGIENTVQNNHLYVLEIGNLAGDNDSIIPDVKLIGNMHGNEVISREILLKLADYLCEKFLEDDPFVVSLVRNTRIHILPSMNPDGFDNAVGPEKNDLRGRYNGNNVDLNRNFKNSDALAFSRLVGSEERNELLREYAKTPRPEIETLMIEDWLSRIHFILSANFHAGSMVVNYPYDSSIDGSSRSTPTPDDAFFRHLSRSYAKYNPRMGTTAGACPHELPFKDGITNGAAWYSVKGGMQDYNYVEADTFEVTVELGCDKFPPPSQIAIDWADNRIPLLNYIYQVHAGVKGKVFGCKRGSCFPHTEANIVVANINNPDDPIEIAHYSKTAKDGSFFRLLPEGDFIIAVCADGYYPAYRVHKVSSMPDIKDREFKTAKRIDYLLRADHRPIEQQLRKLGVTSDKVRTSFSHPDLHWRIAMELISNSPKCQGSRSIKENYWY